MASGDATTSEPSCPFIDLNDPRCASSFTLGRLDRAFDVCLRRPMACHLFYRIALEQRAQGAVAAGIVSLTIAGQALAAVNPPGTVALAG